MKSKSFQTTAKTYESPVVSVDSLFVVDRILAGSNGTGGTTDKPTEQSDANIWNWWEK